MDRTALRAVAFATALVGTGLAAGFASAPAAFILTGAKAQGSGSAPPAAVSKAPGAPPSVELTEKQIHLIQVGPLTTRAFKVETTTVGSIDYDQDSSVQVFTPYQGRIIAVFVKIDDPVKSGQPLFTIDSADLVQAESTLIQTAGVNDLTKSTLARVRRLVPIGGGAQKDLEQAISDQQTAEGNLKAARNALHIYGKSEAEIDAIISDRAVDSTLVVKSPIDGVVAARNASPGLFVQPGSAPAPLTVADIKTKWMVANATEADSAAVRANEAVTARLAAVPGRTFEGRVIAIGESIDPATRRFMVRSEIKDPDNVLRPGMFAEFTISTGSPFVAAALPLGGTVREGDGTLTAWTTEDRRHFTQHVVKLGLEQDGARQVISGLRTGDTVVTDGAVFLDNMLNAPPTD